jgi:hypothetical protein
MRYSPLPSAYLPAALRELTRTVERALCGCPPYFVIPQPIPQKMWDGIGFPKTSSDDQILERPNLIGQDRQHWTWSDSIRTDTLSAKLLLVQPGDMGDRSYLRHR